MKSAILFMLSAAPFFSSSFALAHAGSARFPEASAYSCRDLKARLAQAGALTIDNGDVLGLRREREVYATPELVAQAYPFATTQAEPAYVRAQDGLCAVGWRLFPATSVEN